MSATMSPITNPSPTSLATPLAHPLASVEPGESREVADDLSALAWVQEELRRSLDAAHKSLRRFVKDTETLTASDLDAVDPAVLRSARSQIHQGVGALELVGQPAAATMLRASEALVQRLVVKPQKASVQTVEKLEQASFALLDYLARRLAGKPVPTLALFPQYRAVQEAAGADRVHPADLWAFDWQWRALPADPTAEPRAHDSATHAELEAQLLPLMRALEPAQAAARMSELCAGLGAGADQAQVSTLWKLAAAVFESQTQGLLGFDVFSKRVASRLLAQFRIIEQGRTDVSERLAQDLLFFCAQSRSPGDGRKAPRLAAVRQAYGLVHHVPTDYAASVLGRFDPLVIALARKRVAAVKEAWSAVAGGEMHRATGLGEQFSLVGESLKKLFPFGELLGAELQQSASQTQQSGAAPSAPLAMEVATGLLYVDAALEDAAFDHPEQADRVKRLAERLAAVRQGRAPEPLEAWMEELYRRVSDRQTMGSVVQELRASLSESEKLIDQFFRNPADRQVLIPVPNQLASMRGVLSVVGMDHASSALQRMREEIDGLITTELDPERVAQTGVFDRLAGNLGALGFLIDMLSVQPQMAKTLFTYDPAAGVLRPVMGRTGVSALGRPTAGPVPVEPRLIEHAQLLAVVAGRADVPAAEVSRDLDRLSHEAQAADQPALAAAVHKARVEMAEAGDPASRTAARSNLSDALIDFVNSASDPVGLGPEAAPPAAAAAAAQVSTRMSLDFAPSVSEPELAQDDEMREIFLEEAREVLDTARAAHADLARTPDDLDSLTTLRRAFHTLKGSSRMVGFKAFGDAAWTCEQLYNTQLAGPGAPAGPLVAFTAWVLGYLALWVDDISAKRATSHNAQTVAREAERMQAAPAAAEAVSVSPAPVDLSEPTFDFDLADFEAEGAAEALNAAALPSAMAPLDALDIDLPSRFDAAATQVLRVPSVHAEPATDSVMALLAPDIDLDFGPVPVDADLDIDFDLGPFEAPAAAPMSAAATVLPAPAPAATLAPAPAPSVASMITPLFPAAAAAMLASGGAAAVAAQAADEPATRAADPVSAEEEHTKAVGGLRISIPLFNIYLNEADELSRRLSTELAEWSMELHRPIGEGPIALAHSLAGSSATVGFADLSHLARLLEHAQTRSQALGSGTTADAALFVETADEIRRLLHQFAAGFLREPAAELLARLAEHEVSSAQRLDAAAAESEPSLSEFARNLSVARSVPGVAREPAAVVTRATQFGGLGLADLKPFGALPAKTARASTAERSLVDADDAIDAVDAIDADLFPIFSEEAEELLPQLAAALRDWGKRPADPAPPAGCMRTLHTLKGGARLAGAMRLGEMAHLLESRIEHLLAQESVTPAEVEALQTHADALNGTFDALKNGGAGAEADVTPVDRRTAPRHEPEAAAVAAPTPAPAAAMPVSPPVAAVAVPRLVAVPAAAGTPPLPATALSLSLSPAPAPAPAPASTDIDWSRFTRTLSPETALAAERTQGAQSSVRVRAPLLDRLVNQAGEVSITRSRIEAGVAQIKSSLGDLTENLERLRAQLRDIEFHGEVQMTTRLEAAKAAAQTFDPLEFDRFTRFQELTRMMAESVNDVATVQRTLQRSLEIAEDELVAQARMTRELQDDLLRTRMVEFEGLSDRLYRVVRQTAKETGKSVRLDIVGGSIEVDRGVLDRMTGAFEHLLRNCVGHGIEAPEVRVKAGKEATGSIIVALTHEGNEVGVEFRDDGAGLDLPKIRAKGLALGLLDANGNASDAEVANLIYAPGFSTAASVTELAGRGVGMDVVRAEVSAMGGRLETATTAGQGASFKMVLPLTTAVTQVVMLRCGATRVAVPSTLVEAVRRATPAEVDAALVAGAYTVGDRVLPFFWLGSLLQLSPRSVEAAARSCSLVVIRSAQQRIVLHVDEVLGNHEVVVKNLGAQLSRVPGLAGITLLASGDVALIYNPVALASLYGEAARSATTSAVQAPAGTATPSAEPAPREAPLVMVVDDSLTVRRVTQRLLQREGYRVVLAKDGLDALERLAEGLPAVVLSDIEMPRMDGFDLVRNMRADARLRELPVIMITSRIAQMHRDYAAELGVEHYLGKPYSEEDLLALIVRYTRATVTATATA